MRASESSSTGGVGVTEVCALFERIRWAPLENRDRHDLGTDLLVAARDPRRFDRGVLIGVQVKGGDTWFGEPQLDDTGVIVGWWHREDSEHFDYWIKHNLPHLVVLYDLDSRLGHWVHVTADRCEATGKGVKILVPKVNTVSMQDAPKLLEIALAQRGSISLEGTSFDAAAAHIAPGDRLRYALLIPRLIAPHANRGEIEELEPEEAIALLVLLHVSRLQLLLKKNSAWPSVDSEPKGADWRWHFAHAIWRFIACGDLEPLKAAHLESSVAKNPRDDWRVAAAVVLASAELLGGRAGAAANIINSELVKDAATPVDHAWLLLHSSNCAMEMGNNDGAKESAAEAITELKGVPDDPTASLLGGIGYRIIFNLAGWADGSRDLSATLKAGDNAGSWWRDQQLRWALDAVAIENFRIWARDSSSRWDAEPPGQQLMPCMFMALFSADRSGWAAAESRLGRYEIQNSKGGDQFRSAFVRLIRSGDASSVTLAGKHALDFGPAAELSKLSAACVPQFMAPWRVDTMLTFWAEFGDLGQSRSGDEIVTWCLNRATGKPGSLGGLPKVLDAISSTIPIVSDSAFREVVDCLGRLAANRNDLDRYCRVIEAVEARDSSVLDHAMLLDLARRYSDSSNVATMYGLAAKAGSADARDELLRMIEAKRLMASAVAFDAELLSEGAAMIASQVISDVLARERSEARAGQLSYGGSLDICSFLVALFIDFPAIAQWSVVVDYIGDPHIIADHKEGACRQIVRKRVSLPRQFLDQLLARTSDLASSRYIQANFLMLIRQGCRLWISLDLSTSHCVNHPLSKWRHS